MTKVILVGCCGKMGRFITQATEQRDNVEIIAGVDIADAQMPYTVYRDISKVSEKADCIIDFSHPSSLSATLTYAVDKKISCVIATTGLSEEQKHEIEAASRQIPVFFTANMSIGVNLLCHLAKKASAILGTQFDVEIVEKHHNQKIDAPSGTALMIANEINSVSNNKYYYDYDRHSQRKKREINEIGIHSVRGGNIVGEHEVIFAGHDEVITINHQATSKEVFAVGAVNAALYVSKMPVGLYSMKDMLNKIE